MQIRHLLQLLLGTHVCVHALEGYALPHTLYRRMPPPKLPSPNPPGPTNPRAGRAANQALGPATGAPTEIVDPFTGRLIGDVNPVTGNSHEGFDPLTGYINDLQLGSSQGRRERIRDYGRRLVGFVRPGRQREAPLTRGDNTSPFGTSISPWNIPRHSPPGPSRGGNQHPEVGRPLTPPRHSSSLHTYLPDPEIEIRNPGEVQRYGEMLVRETSIAIANKQEWHAISARVDAEWPAINIDRDYVLEYTQGSPELAEQWRTFMTDPMVTVPGGLGPWTRTTVKTRADDPELLLDLAVYPQQSLVVFRTMPDIRLLQAESTQRLLSELMHQSLRRFNSENNFRFEKYLYPDPPVFSEIWTARTRAIVTYSPLPDGNYVIPENTQRKQSSFFEIIGCRQVAPISYMIAKHPGEVAGPISEVVVLKQPDVRKITGVLIKLRSPKLN